MLRELSVQNLALIEDARVELRGGYCAWTGETGAGKSLLLTALGLVLGGKASADLVRARQGRGPRRGRLRPLGRRRAPGRGRGDPRRPARRRAAHPHPADRPSGRSVAHANGLPVPVATLRKLGDRLIDVHGQHETRTLLDPDRQRRLLDAYGGLEPALDAYRNAREAHDALRRRRRDLIEAAERRRRERDLLAFERDELAAAEPRAGEYDELNREAHRLAESESIREAAAEGYALLYEADRSAQVLLGKVARRLEPLGRGRPRAGRGRRRRSTGWPTRPARSPTGSATSPTRRATTRPGSRRSRPGWPSTGSSPSGSAASPTTWPRRREAIEDQLADDRARRGRPRGARRPARRGLGRA